MKKMCTVVSILFGSMAANSAYSQSSVTLYGVVDAGVGYTSNAAPTLGGKAGKLFQTVSGMGVPSRWGLRGTENLGGGYSAIFVLENGFSSQTGSWLQGGRLFGRQAYVGLQGDKAGSVTIGRQYDPYFDMVGALTAAREWGGQYATHVGDVDNTFATFRMNNSVKYTSPSLSGVVLSGIYAFSNQAPGASGQGFSNNSAWGAAASYTHGALNAAAGYFHLSHPSSGNTGGNNTGGAVAGDYTLYTDIFFTKAVASQDVGGAAASYRVGALTLSGYYSYTKLKYIDNSELNLSNYELNGRYMFSPTVSTGLGFTYTAGNMSGTNLKNVVSGPHPKWIQVNLGATYNLSKRTNLYAIAVYQKALGDATVAAIDYAGGPTGVGVHHQIATAVGITHRF